MLPNEDDSRIASVSNEQFLLSDDFLLFLFLPAFVRVFQCLFSRFQVEIPKLGFFFAFSDFFLDFTAQLRRGICRREPKLLGMQRRCANEWAPWRYRLSFSNFLYFAPFFAPSCSFVPVMTIRPRIIIFFSFSSNCVGVLITYT